MLGWLQPENRSIIDMLSFSGSGGIVRMACPAANTTKLDLCKQGYIEQHACIFTFARTCYKLHSAQLRIFLSTAIVPGLLLVKPLTHRG